MKLILAIILTCNNVFAYRNADELINEINSKQNSWIAGMNYYHGQPMTKIRAMPYVKSIMENAPRSDQVMVHEENVDIPESFDARKNWPKCKNIGVVTDQGACVACYVGDNFFFLFFTSYLENT